MTIKTNEQFIVPQNDMLDKIKRENDKKIWFQLIYK